MNISSSVVWGFVFVVVVIDKAPSKAVDISTISLSFINDPASVFSSSSTTDLKNLPGHKLRVENENKTAKKRAWRILLSVRRIFETWKLIFFYIPVVRKHLVRRRKLKRSTR